jgi:CheY-like chemotaxis protein
MVNDSSGRVLVLENVTEMLELYEVHLRRAGLEVKAVTTLDDAFAELDSRLYSVAVIDLMLNDPIDHGTYDGAHILDACAALNEGTQCIILSAQDSPKVAARLALRYVPFRYIEKAELIGGVSILIEAVREAQAVALESARALPDAIYVQLFGRSGEDSAVSESNLLRELRPAGGPLAFRRAAALSLAPLLPIFPEIQKPSRWDRDSESGVFAKTFWSKGRGLPVLVRIGKSVASAGQATEILRRQAVGLEFVVAGVDSLTRGQFTGSLPESILVLAR